MFQTFRQPATEPLPILAAVLAAIDFSFRPRLRSRLSPGCRIVFGCRDEHEIGILGVPSETVGVNVGCPIRGGPALPTSAATVRHVEAGAAGDVNFSRITRIDQAAVHVVEVFHRAIFILVKADGVELGPAFAFVAAF